MACPSCGGTDRRAIAPGYWECTSLVESSYPTGLHPSGKFGPVHETVASSCGRRYQEGGGRALTTICQTCTVFAIGVCAECGVPQCGNCGAHLDGAFLCGGCREVVMEVRREANAAAVAAAEMVKRDEEAAIERRREARKEWLVETSQALARRGRRTHKDGWAVGQRELREINDGGRRFKRWEQLVLTADGCLILSLKVPGLWGNKWKKVIEPDEEILESVAAYLGVEYPAEG